MTWAEFKKKWNRFQGKESSAYQEHFSDLCRLLGEQTPAEADPSGTESFCFQKRVIKDAELFLLHEDGGEYDAGEERGFADVWKKDCFAWEYKGKKKNLDAAYRQLLRYRESLQNPPLLVVCDFDRYIVKTNFNGDITFKMLSMLDAGGEKLRLTSHNPAYAPRELTVDDLEWVFPVYGFNRVTWNAQRWQAQFAERLETGNPPAKPEY